MVIMNRIDENVRHDAPDIYNNGSPYVYLVDHEQKVMLILKRDLDEMNGICSTDKAASVQEFITEKIHSLLDRINNNGPLSLRELEVLNYAARGKSNKQIADIIGLSESTIKNYFSSTLRKLQANDRTHAVALALCNGWLSIGNDSNKRLVEEASTGTGAIE